MPVYIIRSGSDGPVKIGWAVHVAGRVAALQTGHPGLLTLVRTIGGTPETESWLHRNFAALRMNGEWFRFDTAMLTVQPPMVFKPQKSRLRQIKRESDARPARSRISRGEILCLLEDASRLLLSAGSHIKAFPGPMRVKFLDMAHDIEDIFGMESGYRGASAEFREKQYEELLDGERDNLNLMLIRLINEPDDGVVSECLGASIAA